MIQILHRAKRTVIAAMTDLNRAIHIGEFDPGSAASQFPVQIVPNNAVVAHSQAKVIADTAVHGRSLEFRFGVRRHSQQDAAIDRSQLDRRASQTLELGFHTIIDGRELDWSSQSTGLKMTVDTRGAHLSG